jgi:UDP-N-acetyl-2-amino-2-deoxyglucuronate dehydrogenase
MNVRNFALIGAGGYIAPRHLGAIKTVGGQLLAAMDPNDSVGIIDSHFPDAYFFTQFEQFDAHLDTHLRNGGTLDYVSICSPNHLHDPHIRFALRRGADAICEKPLVLNPQDIDDLAKLEQSTGQKVATILQLRLHEAVIKLRDKYATANKRHQVDLTYITSRGRWYHTSWKGDNAKSGGVATNIGVHFFDMLAFLFGPMQSQVAHLRDENRAAGFLSFKNADVRWFLSIDRNDLPEAVKGKKTTFRAIEIDGEDAEFSEGFTELHNDSYREIVAGRGFTLDDVRPSIETVAGFRHMPLTPDKGERHPFVSRFVGA